MMGERQAALADRARQKEIDQRHMAPPSALNTGIPVIIDVIFPVSALAQTYVSQTVHRIDPHQIFGVLIAQLPLDAQPQGAPWPMSSIRPFMPQARIVWGWKASIRSIDS